MPDATEPDAAIPRSPKAMALARAIRAARGSETQVELAERLRRPQSTISMWERGLAQPNLDALSELDEAFGLPLGTLALRAGYFSPPPQEALPLHGDVIRELPSREETLAVIAAAVRLGLTVRARCHQSGDSSEDEGAWTVAITLPSETR